MSSTLFGREKPPNYNYEFWLVMCLIGVMFFTCSYLFNLSMSLITANQAAPLMLISIPVSLILDKLFYDREMTDFEIIGISLITGVNILLVILKLMKKA